MNDVMTRLREETRAHHKAAERQPLARAMMRRELDLVPFGDHLWGFRFLYTQLVEALAASDDEAVRRVWDERLDRRPHLDRDLAALEAERPASLGRWEITVEDGVAALAAQGGSALLGALYVLEGSALGAQVIVKRLEGQVPDEALHYYRGHGAATREGWGRFCAHMGRAVTTPADQDACVHGAAQTFDWVAEMFDAIWTAWNDGTVSMTRRVARALQRTA